MNYEAELKIDKFLLIVQGTPEEVKRAKHPLDATTSTVTTLHAEPVLLVA